MMLTAVLFAATVVVGLAAVLLGMIFILKYDTINQLHELEKRVTDLEHVLRDHD